MSSQGAPEAAEKVDASARICAWADHLAALGRTDEARQVLLDALAGPGDPVPIMIALAELEADAGETARAAERLRKVIGDDPGNVAAVRALARTWLAAGDEGEAVRVIADACASAVPGTDKSRQFAEDAGELHMHLGRHAAAVAAFGPRAELSPYARTLRRRAWWRSGGPLRRRRVRGTAAASATVPDSAGPGAFAAGGAVAAGTTPAGTTGAPADTILEAITWAAWLRDEGRLAEARRVAGEAIAAHGRHPALLACAARIEDAARADNTALFLWREACQRAPGDVDVACGLALCFASLERKYFPVARVRDALRVLDGFPDQACLAIGDARYQVLDGIGSSAARLAAAYGPGSSLSGWRARRRRRLLRRSTGPFGQFCVRVIDRTLDRHPKRQIPVEGIEAESEEIARVLDAVQRLTPAEARELIEETMRGHGRQASLLLARAEADESEGASWQRLAVTAEAARVSGGNADAVCALAMALRQTHGHGTALQALTSLPADTPQLRGVAAELLFQAGNRALAFAVVGDLRDMNGRGRKRLRLMKLVTLPLRLRTAGRDGVPTMDVASFDPVPLPVARVLDEAPPPGDEQARETLRAAVDEHGRHPLLLLQIASAERWNGDRHVAAALASEAARTGADDPLIVAKAIRELWSAGYVADALHAIGGLSGDLATAPAVRVVAGDLCETERLRAHAFRAYGDGIWLEAWARRDRRACWRRSGGPAKRIRSAIGVAERRLLHSLEPSAAQEAALSALSLPPPIAEAARADVAAYRLGRFRVTTFLPELGDAWGPLIVLPPVILAIFGALASAETLRWPSESTVENLAAAALATIAVTAATLMLGRFGLKVKYALPVLTAIGVGAWLSLRSGDQAVFSVGLALAGLGAVPFILLLLRLPVQLARRVRRARWLQSQAEEAALEGILALLGYLNAPRLRRDIHTRRTWMTELERLAVIIERDLPYTLASGDPGSQQSITAHARGAAAALRQMKETIALPAETSWRELTDLLRGLARALAGHDFSSWPPPLPEATAERPARPPWRRATDAARTAVVFFAPPLVAFLLPLAAPLSGPGVPWLRFATTVWALLGIIIALDPDWSNRIAKMRQWLDLMRSATPPPDYDSGSSPCEPATATPPQDDQAPRRPSSRPPRIPVPRPTAKPQDRRIVRQRTTPPGQGQTNERDLWAGG